MTEQRIVSLIASATEIVAALGLLDRLVGRSHECDYPPAVTRLPMCSEPKIDVHGTSREIDERVKAVLQEAVSVYRVFGDELERLSPTVIITQTQCEVCAVSLADVQAAVCDLVGSNPKIVALEPMDLRDVWRDILQVADAVGVPERGRELTANLQNRLKVIQSKTAGLSKRPRVACLEWIDPLMAAGNWVPELVEIAGGVNLFGKAGLHSPWMTWEELVASDPDVIAIMPCGFDISRTMSELGPLTSRAEWARLSAVKTGRVVVTDGNQYFNRPGPRLVESAEILAEIFHPGEFDFGHKGTGWVRLGS
jgi:iron complex transport system substrate-binding protein